MKVWPTFSRHVVAFTINIHKTKVMDKKQLSKRDDDFKPVGAIVFFLLLIALAALIWFSIYNIQVERHL